MQHILFFLAVVVVAAFFLIFLLQFQMYVLHKKQNKNSKEKKS